MQIISPATTVKPLERLRAKAAPIWESIRTKAKRPVSWCVKDADYLADLAEAAVLGGCPPDVANLIANTLQYLADDLKAARLWKAIGPAD
jgi:hypothetical protein